MRLASPRLCTLLLALAALSASHALAADPDENAQRVKLMSRNERARLSKSLEDFDALDSDVRTSIRDLDARLNALEPEARNRALSVLRRYHVFYKNLPDEKRRAIDAETDQSKKLELIASLRAEQRQAASLRRQVGDGVQVSALSTVRLRQLARDLIIYFSLDPTKDAKERAEFAKLKTPNERRQYGNRLFMSKGFEERAELKDRIQAEASEFQEATKKVLDNPIQKARFKRGEDEIAKAEQNAKKRADNPSPKRAMKDAVAARRPGEDLIERLDEQQVIREMDGEAVDPGLLEKFEAALPPWARQGLDDLPPDAARRRLKAIYRLVFPSGTEYEPPKAVEPPPKPTRQPGPPTGDAGTPF